MAGRHRRPPTPHWNSPSGQCRWCGTPILDASGAPNLRRNWHPECVTTYRLATGSEQQRRVCWERDSGICAACGVDTTKIWCGWRRIGDCWLRDGVGSLFEAAWTWEADHIVPLHLVDRTAADALRFWGAGNLQTLCVPCHKAKTAAEAASRSKKIAA